MIIGEQRINENNYYENYSEGNTNHQFEVLKRKLSSENETDVGSYSDQSEVVNSNIKMQYVDNSITEYHTYQTEQIHQDGDQSYINLTVMTPTLIHYDKGHLTCQTQQQQPQLQQLQQEQQNYSNRNIQEGQQKLRQQSQLLHNSKQIPNTNIGKFEVRNYQQTNHQTGKQIFKEKP